MVADLRDGLPRPEHAIRQAVSVASPVLATARAPSAQAPMAAAPLVRVRDLQVAFDDGTRSTVKQQSEDVAAFLMWAAEPKMEERKKMGFSVLIFLVLFSGLLYASYRRVWKNESH